MQQRMKVEQFPRRMIVITFTITCVIAFSLTANAADKAKFIDLSSHWAWIDEQWTGNNRFYNKTRANLDKIGFKTAKYQEVLNVYRAIAIKNPSDPLAQFRWGYLAYRLASRSDHNHGVQMMNEVTQSLAVAPSPHTYQYTRLRLLAGNWVEFYFPPIRVFHTRTLGERLLNRDPNDYQVKYVLASILDTSGTPENRQIALRFAKQLVDTRPSDPTNRALLGSIYYTSWQFNKQQSDADRAIAAYQQYLELAPPNDTFRKMAQSMIDKIRQRAASPEKG